MTQQKKVLQRARRILVEPPVRTTKPLAAADSSRSSPAVQVHFPLCSSRMAARHIQGPFRGRDHVWHHPPPLPAGLSTAKGLHCQIRGEDDRREGGASSGKRLS